MMLVVEGKGMFLFAAAAHRAPYSMVPEVLRQGR